MTESKKKVVNWAVVEREYRAGIKTLRQIGLENGCSHVAIQKRADREGWSRDLKAKIIAKAEEKVTKALVTSQVTKDQKVTEQVMVEATAEIIARADLVNREDVLLALDVSRSQLREVAALGNPEFLAELEWLGEIMDESGIDDAGKPTQDRANALYRYIIGLAGRVKLSKEIAASHGVYIPMQRKILKLDEEADKSQTQLDALLAKINAGA